jgi:hypothetical protein
LKRNEKVNDMKRIGYSELVTRFGLNVLAADRVAYLVEHGHRRTRTSEGRTEEFYPARQDPGTAWTDHLAFALKHEGVNLEVLAALFGQVSEQELTAWIAAAPISRYTRLAWFFYEWLTGKELPLQDLSQGNYQEVLDPALYYALPPDKGAVRVRRQRLINNLPGTSAYCPLVRRTPVLEAFILERLDEKTRERLSHFPEEILHRAAQYLYLKETKSSYAIEHLQPDRRRTTRFVELLRRSGQTECFSEVALVALQRAIVDERYAAAAFRDFQNFIGQSLGPGRELVHFVPPQPEDIHALMEGWMACCRGMMAGGLHPVVAATVAGFGFVFLHPFEDGNGRLHRFLIHHVLTAGGFTPEGIIFPVSAMMLKQPLRYDAMLESYSRKVMEHVEYRFEDQGKLVVSNPTASFYRFPDMTWLTERMFELIRDTLTIELDAELEYLVAFDTARREMREVVDMPDARLDLFIRLCLQEHGQLSKNKRSQFGELTDEECARLQNIVGNAIGQIKST